MNYKIKGLEVEITDEQLDELIKERENKGKPWKPEKGEYYWFVGSWGDVSCDDWRGSSEDIFYLKSNNVFKTKGEAEAKLDYLNAVIAVNAKIRELNDGWTPDWMDYSQSKNNIRYNYDVSEFFITSHWQETEFSILNFIKSKELAEQVIKECAKELEIIKNYNLK